MAGVLPGILTGLLIMVVCGYFAFRYKYGAGDRVPLLQGLLSFKRAILSLLLIIIVIGALLAIQTYIKRGVQGRLKSAADCI